MKYLNRVIFLIMAVILNIVMLPNINVFADEPVTMDVFYSIDDRNAARVGVSLASLLLNLSESENLRVHLVVPSDAALSAENTAKIDDLQKLKSFELNITALDMDRLRQISTGHWCNGCLTKLFGSELFPELERVLWFDDDIIVTQNIREHYFRDMTGKYYAAVDIAKQYNKEQDQSKAKHWISSGTLLCNLTEMRRDEIQEKFIERIREYSCEDRKKLLPYQHWGTADEYALTMAVGEDKIINLPYRYTIMAPCHDERNYNPEDYNEIENCIFLHFCTKKPWDSHKGLIPDFYETWWYYAKLTDFWDSLKEKYDESKELWEPGKPFRMLNMDGMFLARKLGDSSDWLEIHSQGKYSLIVRCIPIETGSTDFGKTNVYQDSNALSCLQSWYNSHELKGLKDLSIYSDASTKLGIYGNREHPDGLSTPSEVEIVNYDKQPFLLSFQETSKFLGETSYETSQKRYIKCSEDARKMVSRIRTRQSKPEWLRTQTASPACALSILKMGIVIEMPLSLKEGGLVRPALWINNELYKQL